MSRTDGGYSPKSHITCLAGSIFGALPRLLARIHRLNLQRHAQLLAERAAMVFKQRGSGLQAVVNVHCTDLPWPFFGASNQ